MMNWATFFFTIACIPAIVMFLDISTPVNKISKIFCGIFTVLFILTLVFGW
jgi:uncharacterized membrane protein YtjA (UPF0391 family)